MAAWVYIGLFVFTTGFWIGAWLWWNQWKRAVAETERVREKAVEHVFRTGGWGIAQLAMLYADLGGTGRDARDTKGRA